MSKTLKKMGRPISGREKKERYSLRLEPKQAEAIMKRFGGIQAWVNHCLKFFIK